MTATGLFSSNIDMGTQREFQAEREREQKGTTHSIQHKHMPKDLDCMTTTLCSSSSTLRHTTQTTSLTPHTSPGQVTETQNIRNSRALTDCYQVTPTPFSQGPNFLKDILDKGLSITLNVHWDILGDENSHHAASSLAKQL